MKQQVEIMREKVTDAAQVYEQLVSAYQKTREENSKLRQTNKTLELT
jgi:hypothetical protein